MLTPARWVFPEASPERVAALVSALKVSALAARVLLRRGIVEPVEAERFLRPALAHLHDPFLMLGMRAAVDRLRRAIELREKILLYGDYDVDGTCAVVILKTAIELAGGSVDYHVPHRLREGYGMKADIIEQAAADGVSLVVSVDTGIRAVDAVRSARDRGIDVIVTDHHLPEVELPPALAILNPNQPDCTYPERHLCGAGVAFKLVCALMSTLPWPAEKVRALTDSFLKLAAIATVADVVPLTGENRVIVRHGLEGLRDVRSVGLRALMKVAGLTLGEAPSAGQIAFRIAPRINAAGRMDNARDVIDLFVTRDAARANALAEQLHALNFDRQQTEAAIVEQILAECRSTPITDSQMALVFSGKDWHRGVVGIVASRLVENFHRPVFVLSEEDDGQAQGSGRSLYPFHLLEAMESMAALFTRFGGHRQAAGLSIPAARVGEFRERLNAYAAERLTPADFQPVLEIDAECDLDEVDGDSIQDVLALAPFGFGNPAPLFAARDLEVVEPPYVMKEKHLRLKLRKSGKQLEVKAWNFIARIDELKKGARIDAALAFESSSFGLDRGYPNWSATLKDVRPA
jgi:single-stranded-DNA-specific exonuclease